MKRETCLADCWDWVTEADVAAVLPEAFAYARDLVAMPEIFDGKPNVFDDDGQLWCDRKLFAQYLAEGAFKAVARLVIARGIDFEAGDSSANLDLEPSRC